MADSNEPKKENIRITLPPRPPLKPAGSESEAERTNLPTPSPGGGTPPLRPPPFRPPSAIAVRPPPLPGEPTATPPLPATAVPSAAPVSAGGLPLPPTPPATPQRPGVPPPPKSDIADRGSAVGPRKETARVAAPQDTPMKATVRLSNIPASTASPAGLMRSTPLPVASPPPAALVAPVPATFCWALLGVSALTLLIQLWTYFS